MRMQYLELWGDFAKLRLAGKSTNEISEITGLSIKASTGRARILDKLIAEQFPALYQWWKPHQDYIDRRLSPQVENEYQYFTNWLKQLIEQS
ncbi:hypothetical protein MTZ49_07445 [Entomomonas sp. E2T0]|uniref:hypothetical protein n=1 Tax=Entomomonas sp. E2T0 TaxID=2930213 RepID=UPI00222843B0|nr:hypothetical protein [Entomomonas sp. E2T0]UYZ85372.1 hypothetical protein MTZ49_07445 [Entomomonas sp. E2T0]